MKVALALCALACVLADTETFSVTIRNWGGDPVTSVDPRELSYTWDNYALNPIHFPGPMDLSNPGLRSLTRQLGKSVLRVSGTGAENIQIEGSSSYVRGPPEAVLAALGSGGGGTDPFNATFADWDQVAEFAVATGSDLVLGLNQFTRQWPTRGICRGDCAWIATNAKAWMQHNLDKKWPLFGYELGNEPGCYMSNPDSTGISPANAAADFVALKELVSDVYRGAAKVPLVLGPDVGGCTHASQNAAILAAGAPLAVDVLTFHHYVIGGAVTHGNPNYINVSSMRAAALSDTTRTVISSFLPAWRANATSAALWLGEGGTTCGNPKVQSSFAMIFNAFDILQQGGLLGVSVFVKQSLKSFFNHPGPGGVYQPLAFYWFAFLWKREMTGKSTAVFEAEVSTTTLLVAVRGRGVALLNLGMADVVASLQSSGERCEMYTLAPDPVTGPAGDAAQVNGELLTAGPDGSLPTVAAVPVPCDSVPVSQNSVVFLRPFPH